MLERTAERNVASGQCFAADEGDAFVSSFMLDDYDRADDVPSIWIGSVNRQSIEAICLSTRILEQLVQATIIPLLLPPKLVLQYVFYPSLFTLFDPVLSRRPIYIMLCFSRPDSMWQVMVPGCGLRSEELCHYPPIRSGSDTDPDPTVGRTKIDEPPKWRLR